jgi:molecular chaperone HtpG
MQGKLSIHSENILPIIKRWLYSEKEIFLRELVSNATDALQKLQILQNRQLFKDEVEELKIEISTDKENKILTISDNGIGMTKEEVEKYIAQIAFSGAEEFLKKYESPEEKDHIIGHFGLGFYSSYMVAKKVDIETLSFEGKDPVFWSCDGGSNYFINTGKRTLRGTDIILHLEEGNEEYLEEAKIRELIVRYSPYLPFSLYLNGKKIEQKNPLWLKSPSQCTEKEYIDFYHDLYPTDPDPIFWIHINMDYPFAVQGIIYFPKIDSRFDFQKTALKLFCNRIFVSDNCKDLFADYLTILRGVIDSRDLPLNVSRSFLQMDKNIKQLSQHISKKISDRLQNYYQTEKEKFYGFWPDIEWIVKLGVLQDEKFYERSKDFLIWKANKDLWMTADEYIKKHGEKTKNKIFYTQDDKSPQMSLYREKDLDVLYLRGNVDLSIMSFLERKIGYHFQRIDSVIDDVFLDPSKEKNLLREDGRSEAAHLADQIKGLLGVEGIDVEAKSFASSKSFGFLLMKEEERRFRDYLQMMGEKADFGVKRTFVVNTNHGLIKKLEKVMVKDAESGKDLVKYLYEMALLSQGELKGEDLGVFIERGGKILEELVDVES